ncbi:MAG: N-acetylmuramoyl-L-alanine amidase [Planctomycetes bacterium]|nr:N-acetylmuramoyl-L-alanine amidase [Planctomycetota bacterium]
MQTTLRRTIVRSFVNSDRRIRIIITILACCCLPSCATGLAGSSPPSNPDFQEADRLFRQGSYERAINRFSKLILFPTGRRDEALMARCYQSRGASRKAIGKYSLARYDFEDAINIAEAARVFSEKEDLILDCRIAIGDTYLLEGAYQKGDQFFEKIIAADPPTPYRDALLYRRYICSLKLNRPDPDRFKREISNMCHFDEEALRRAFLDGGTPTPLYGGTTDIASPTAHRSLGTLEIIPRNRWHARLPRSNIDPMTSIYRITVHHTGDYCNQTDLEGSAALMLAYQQTHQESRGWADLGYHFVIDRAGRIWEGRSLEFQGAHAGDSEKNRGNIGISLMGDFNRQELSRGQEESLANLLNELSRLYRIDKRSRIFTHQELVATQCPGRNLQYFVDRFRELY